MNLKFPVHFGGLCLLSLLQTLVQPAMADDCKAIVNAVEATLNAPAYKQYFTPKPGIPERLMSIVVGDSVYLMLAGASAYQTMPRQEIQATAKDAIDGTTFQSCALIGNEAVNGVTTKVYQYSYSTKDGDSGQSKVWIDGGSLLRKQGTADGTLRYEYEDVKAPSK